MERFRKPKLNPFYSLTFLAHQNRLLFSDLSKVFTRSRPRVPERRLNFALNGGSLGQRQFNYSDLSVSSHRRSCAARHHGDRLTRHRRHAAPHDAPDAAGLQLREDLGEVARLRVYPQHVGGEPVDNVQAAVPELLLGVLDEEGLQGVRDLVAHVRVREVEAGEDDGLQVLLAVDVLLDEVADQHVHEDDVRGVDEGYVLEKFQWCDTKALATTKCLIGL